MATVNTSQGTTGSISLVHLLPSGRRSHNYGQSPFLMGKSTISMAILDSQLRIFPGIAEESTFLGRLALW